MFNGHVAMTTQASTCSLGCRTPPPEFPDMTPLFRETIAVMGRDVFEAEILARINNEPMACCAASHVSNVSLINHKILFEKLKI